MTERGNGTVQTNGSHLRVAPPLEDLQTPLVSDAFHRSPLCQRYLSDFAPLLAHSPKMRGIREIIEEVAPTTATLLIRGESGVGKEVVARAVAAASPRPLDAFVKVNCAALPAELLESELFGHEKGAFTGAYRRKIGKFEFADKGTLFLDEIGELPLALQAKLLHVLQDGEFSRVGGREIIRVDTRVIASTNRDLVVAISRGDFREDLYYRLNVVEIEVPPLRERREEIAALAEYFLEKYNRQAGRRAVLPPEVMDFFVRYDWPGNVRQLENIVRRLVVLGNVARIHEEVLNTLRTAPTRSTACHPGVLVHQEPASPMSPASSHEGLGLRAIARHAAREAERRALQEVLAKVRWNRIEAARVLKVSYKTLLIKMSECGLGSKSGLPLAR